MLKKITSLLLSFLLCLSLLPGHAYAANESDLPQPPVIEEPLGASAPAPSFTAPKTVTAPRR